MFAMDFEAVRERAYEALAAMRKEIADGPDVEPRYLERLERDRNLLIFALHWQLDVPVLELAQRTGIPWMSIYDLIDEQTSDRRKSCPTCGSPVATAEDGAL